MRVALTAALSVVLSACAGNFPKEIPSANSEKARIVVFRGGGIGTLGPVPVVTLNGEELGEAGVNTLYLRDVEPGEHAVTLEPRGIPGVHIAAAARGQFRQTFAKGSETYFEVGTLRENCKPRGPLVLYTTPAGALAAALAYGLISAATKDDGMDCDQVPALQSLTGDEARSKLAALSGKSVPAIVTLPPMDSAPTTEPQGERAARPPLPTASVEALIREHFERNREAYDSYIESRHFSTINLRRVTLQRALPGETPEFQLLVMELEGDKLPVTVTGHLVGFRRVFFYVVEHSGDKLTVKDWQVGSSTALAGLGQATPTDGIDVQTVHRLVQLHFDSNRTAYAHYIETTNPDTLRARSITLLHQAPGPDPQSWDLLVRIDGDRTMDVGRAGFRFTKNFQYRATKQDNSLHIAEWRPG